MDRPHWVRPVVAIVVFVGLGAVGLAAAVWLAVTALPDADQVVDEAVEENGTEPEVAEVGPAPPDAYIVEVTRCEVADGRVEVGGRLENTTPVPQAFVVHVSVLFGDQLFDGQTTPIGVPTVGPGEDSVWSQTAGSVDPEDIGDLAPACEVDRVGLGDELVD